MDVLAELKAQSTQLREASYGSDLVYDQQIRTSVTSLRQVISDESLGDLARSNSLLNNIDPAADSLLYLFLLRFQIRILQKETRQPLPAALLPMGEIWPRIVSYLGSFDSVQSRYVGEEWRQLVELVAHIAQACSQPLVAVRLIRDAMLRLDPSCIVLTSTHLLLVRLCLRARAYSCALPVLDRYICHFPSSKSRADDASSPLLCASHDSSLCFITDASGLSSKLTYKDYLQYYLYGGMIYLALKQWTKAVHFLGIVISMPTTGSVSMIMVEAYKKWILVNLLDKGKVPSPSSLVAPNVVRVYQSLAKPYVNLAEVFEGGDISRLEAEIDAAHDVWRADNNLGLVSQVHSAHTKYTVTNITKTFAALTVRELRKQACFSRETEEATESAIASLIMSNAISATLVHSTDPTKSTMVRFTDGRSAARLAHEQEIQVELAREGQLLRTLSKSMGDVDYQLGLSNEFIDSLQMSQGWAVVGESRTGKSEDAGVEIDEDLMGDEA
ncbi:COP9 signalosome complex subunit 3 [Penicillium oxalicum]|uniref:COP9 signalosome complex subunit 3 n=1 Tax=Penicillium oxalicum (strain 114-2 / CGMCC 5302) TaxID=933388 RepID=S8ASP4_PENO1|nr:COP9 signalosome complex subunit 3 [Penicillium oxalicum]EPS29113.1 hypothetical protein PDE_04062 [Penicillium oxalicum 114-2]KAI2787791.1 COP9 signalosome complex subunit 3 [Penicillium oxalicum]